MVYSFLSDLINIPSITGSEAEIGRFLENTLVNRGWNVTAQPVTGDRINIYAKCEEPGIVFSTHMDTVPAFIPFSEDGRYIYGRGACDAKGCIAVQLEAAEHLRNLNIPVGLLFVVGEERGSDGADTANELCNESRYIINGEPTGNKLASSTKGVLRIQVKTAGKAAHSAYPESGESAILALISLLHDINTTAWPDDHLIGLTTGNIGTISGGVTGNVIPETAEAEIMFRTVTDTCTMIEMLTDIIADRAEMNILYSCDPIRMHVPDGFSSEPVSFATDITSLTNWGEPLLIGPGSIHDAHSDHEKVLKKELDQAVELYVKIARNLLSK